MLEEMPDLAFIIETVVDKHKEKTSKYANTNLSVNKQRFLNEQTTGNELKTRVQVDRVKELTTSVHVRKEVKDRVGELLVEGKTPSEVLITIGQEFPNGVMIEDNK
ncbi:hypothetical protein P4493_06145 [Bacillus thuringiensis]|jgi:hypothetical protein|uniref:Uncharacterized protein n=3 Tax=Bacillus thuringiensis TaxID=1428 RepID=A0A0B5NJF3_BACTU|nr:MULTISPECIES: hypothetical protein [Bacillus]EAO56540.1 hypothetical protein RBTH_06739 [Bacillus thuringiensis serovar israelensis ATCC 35646]MEC2533145.1 hypothetical protein [Bacillus cereus]MED1153875.1 hypothetical protein [Bacillus paranthracis]OUB09274.1 hypothetical protein BK708_32615 [Bacillus thuringiensis serovar yunnanensis]AFQ30184.1 hypothetical protein BTF1_30417 [Bacillus thuringiensis HD-789]